MNYLTPAATAEYLGVHINTVYRLIQKGELKATRLGQRLLRISEQEIQKYLEVDNATR